MKYHKLIKQARKEIEGSIESKKPLIFIGKNIRDRRKKIGLIQIELARMVGLSRTSITNIETGVQNPPILTLMKIAEALDVELVDLINYRERKEKCVNEILEITPGDVDFLNEHLRIEVDHGSITKIFINLREVYSLKEDLSN